MSWFKKYLYANGNFGGLLLTQTMITWLMYYYAPPANNPQNLVPLVPIFAIGIAVFIGRIVDAIADPIVGYWSDRINTPWGRRIPFVFLGNLPLIICFILLWNPPHSFFSMANLWHAVIFLSAFFLFFTIVLCPYLALLPEIAKTAKERINLSTWMAFMTIGGSAMGMSGSSFLIAQFGFQKTGLILGGIAFVALLGPVMAIKEKQVKKRKVEKNFISALMNTFKNKPFTYYIVTLFFATAGLSLAQTAVPYIITVLLGRAEKEVGLLLGVMMLTAVANFWTVNMIAKYKGKKVAFKLTLLGFILSFPIIFILGTNILPFSSLSQGFLLMFLLGFPLAGYLILPFALIADITDVDEKITGKRREAMYFGMQGLVTKTAVGLATLVFSFLLKTYGYSMNNYLGIQLVGIIASVFIIFGLIAFWKYPLRN